MSGEQREPTPREIEDVTETILGLPEEERLDALVSWLADDDRGYDFPGLSQPHLALASDDDAVGEEVA